MHLVHASIRQEIRVVIGKMIDVNHLGKRVTEARHNRISPKPVVSPPPPRFPLTVDGPLPGRSVTGDHEKLSSVLYPQWKHL